MSTLSVNLHDNDSPYVDKKTVETLSKEISKIITDQIFQSMKDVEKEQKRAETASK